MAQKDAKQIESVEHVPSGEHGGGFPPFQKDTFASQLLWFALVFVGMSLPLVVLFAGFLALIGSPAIVHVISGI